MQSRRADRSVTGVITDIQRFSVHDGTGIRTILFLKGCPMRCPWCHNPETNRAREEMCWYRDRCIGCGECVRACPRGAILPAGGYDPARCDSCGRCAEVCCTKARVKLGRIITVAEAMDAMERDAAFYRRTGGGLTLSGGEPTAQPLFSAAMMRAAHERGIHTALETCGCCDWQSLWSIAAETDLVLYDVKHTDGPTHRRLTGVDNDVILENLRRLSRQGSQIILRMPLIPGINDQRQNLLATARLAAEVRARQIHLLPFHQLGEGKWHALARTYVCEGRKEAGAEAMNRAREIMLTAGVPVNIGGAGA